MKPLSPIALVLQILAATTWMACGTAAPSDSANIGSISQALGTSTMTRLASLNNDTQEYNFDINVTNYSDSQKGASVYWHQLPLSVRDNIPDGQTSGLVSLEYVDGTTVPPFFIDDITAANVIPHGDNDSRIRFVRSGWLIWRLEGDSTTWTEYGTSEVCRAWFEATTSAKLDEGTWSGKADGCLPGDITGTTNSLNQLNLYRQFAGLPAVELTTADNASLQECALMMGADSRDITHYPTDDWACYSEEGKTAAGQSLISTFPPVAAIVDFLIDRGNPDLGHRRWLLSTRLTSIGVGSVMRSQSPRNATCLKPSMTYDFDNELEWSAWPPPNTIPLEALKGSGSTVDSTGWSLQSDILDLTGASVEVTLDGEPKPVEVVSLTKGSFSSIYNTAIRFTPQGWTTVPGVYHVSASGPRLPNRIEYDVTVVGCGLGEL